MFFKVPLSRYYFNLLNLKLILICFCYGLFFCNLFDFNNFLGISYCFTLNFVINLITIFSEIIFLFYISSSERIKLSQWTLIAEVKLYVVLLLFISGLLAITGVLSNIMELDLFSFFKIIIFVFCKGLFPISLLLLVKIYNSKKDISSKSDIINASTSRKQIETNNFKEILLVGKNRGEHFLFIESSIVFLKAEDNYVTVFFYNEDHIIDKITLRSTLGEIEDQIFESSILKRCHRSYIINIYKIIKILGNSRKYSIQIESSMDEIPLGFKYYNQILMNYNKIKQSN